MHTKEKATPTILAIGDVAFSQLHRLPLIITSISSTISQYLKRFSQECQLDRPLPVKPLLAQS